MPGGAEPNGAPPTGTLKDEEDEEAGESLPLLLSACARSETLLMEAFAVRAALETDVPDNPDVDDIGAKCEEVQPRRERLEEADAPVM